MTQKLFQQDSYQKKAQARVTASGPGWVQLDQSIFYARSGGQPGDRGVIRISGQSYQVADTLYESDRSTIKHLLEDETVEVPEGETAEIEIEWERRYRLMRMHSSMHLLCSLVHAPVTGGGVGESDSRVEFDIETADFDKQVLTTQLNELIEQDLPVAIGQITEQELDDNPGLVRTMSVQPPRGAGTIRMIKIGDSVDYQPCGGTHISRTGEIGRVELTSIKSKGKRNKRFNIRLLQD